MSGAMVDAVVGVFTKTGSAIAVTVGDVFDEPSVVDRRTLDLTDAAFSRFVYHAASELDGAAARRFVQRCTTGVGRRARAEVDALLRDLRSDGVRIARGAIVDANKPFTALGLERILASHSLLHAAEGELYRAAVVEAFGRHSIEIEPIPRGELASRAARAVGTGESDAIVTGFGRAVGSPWRREHKDAALAALAASGLTV
jgi:hypothetical protein